MNNIKLNKKDKDYKAILKYIENKGFIQVREFLTDNIERYAYDMIEKYNKHKIQNYNPDDFFKYETSFFKVESNIKKLLIIILRC